MQQGIARLIIGLAHALVVAGARISIRSQIDAGVAVSSRIGPEGEAWEMGTPYACMQKWRSSGAFSSGGFVDNYCLAKLNDAVDGASDHLRFAGSLDACASSKEPHKMKVCSLKGDKPDRRISYASKSYVPKSCFRVSNLARDYPVIETAIDDKGCNSIMKSSVGEQGQIALAITTTTTTSSTTTTTITIEDEPGVECACNDGFVGRHRGDKCSCKPAPCGVIGSVNDGTSCKCMPGLIGDITWSGKLPVGECMAEARGLFTEGHHKLWKYKGKGIKCCVSTAWKPTELQDLNAEVLPSEGYMGRSDPYGCGYMFGDQYHNGMKPYGSRNDPTCPVYVTRIMELAEISFEEVKDLLELDSYA